MICAVHFSAVWALLYWLWMIDYFFFLFILSQSEYLAFCVHEMVRILLSLCFKLHPHELHMYVSFLQ